MILRGKVDFPRQQPDRNRQNRAATVDGEAVRYETSKRAISNKMQQNLCPIKFRTLNLPPPESRAATSRASGRKQAKHRIPVSQSQNVNRCLFINCLFILILLLLSRPVGFSFFTECRLHSIWMGKFLLPGDLTV